MAQKLAALLCLAWVFGSPLWSKAMDRDPNGLALMLAYPLWAVFGPGQLVLTLMVFGFASASA